MFIYRIWDKTSPINGVQAEKVLEDFKKQRYEQFYLIEQNGVVEQIQCESYCPYKGNTFEDSARLHCEALNASFTANQVKQEAIK